MTKRGSRSMRQSKAPISVVSMPSSPSPETEPTLECRSGWSGVIDVVTWDVARLIEVVVIMLIVFFVAQFSVEVVVPYECSAIATDMGLSSVTTDVSLLSVWAFPCLAAVLLTVAADVWLVRSLVRWCERLLSRFRRWTKSSRDGDKTADGGVSWWRRTFSGRTVSDVLSHEDDVDDAADVAH